MRKVCVSIYLIGVVFVLSLIFSSLSFGESGPLTNKPKGDAPATKVDQIKNLLPDLIVSDISEDNYGTIIVKIKNIGRGYIQESAHARALVELEIDRKGSKISLISIDPNKVLLKPGGEVIWNTGAKTQGNQTEVIVRIDITNVIQESAETNNQLGKNFKKIGFGGIDLKIRDLKKYSTDYSYYAEIENVGEREFKGDIYFEIIFKDNAHGNVWKRVLPPYVSLINSSNIFDSKLEVPANPIICRNVTILPHQSFNTSNPSCSHNYLFKLTPQPPDIGVEMKIKFETNNRNENMGNNEFIKHIVR